MAPLLPGSPHCSAEGKLRQGVGQNGGILQIVNWHMEPSLGSCGFLGACGGEQRAKQGGSATPSRRATPCHAVPCHAVPRCATLCRTVPRRAMPCHAVPCRAISLAGSRVPGYLVPEAPGSTPRAHGTLCPRQRLGVCQGGQRGWVRRSGGQWGAEATSACPEPPQPPGTVGMPQPRAPRPCRCPWGGRPGLALGSAGCNGGGPLQPGWGRRWVPPALPLLPAPRVEAAPALSCGFRWSLTPHKAPRNPFESEKGSERRALTFNLQVSPSTPLPPAPGTPPRAMPDRAKPWSPPEPGTGDGGRDRGWEQAAQAAPPLRYVGAGNCPSVPGVRQDLPHRSRLGSTAPPLLFRAGAAPQGLGKLSFDPAPQPPGTWGCPHFGGLLGGSGVVGVEGTGSLREGELHPCIPASLHPRISAALHLRSPALQPSLCPLHHHGSGY